MTVFSPMLEISRSCSLSDNMFVHSVSTMISTWYSFTLPTSGPRLQEEKPDRMKRKRDAFHRQKGCSGSLLLKGSSAPSANITKTSVLSTGMLQHVVSLGLHTLHCCLS